MRVVLKKAQESAEEWNHDCATTDAGEPAEEAAGQSGGQRPVALCPQGVNLTAYSAILARAGGMDKRGSLWRVASEQRCAFDELGEDDAHKVQTNYWPGYQRLCHRIDGRRDDSRDNERTNNGEAPPAQ